MKTIMKSLISLIFLVLFLICCSPEKEEEGDYLLKVKTVANVCVIHDSAPVGAGVILEIDLHQDCHGEILVQENITTDPSGCISLVTPYYDIDRDCTFYFYANEPNVGGSNVFLNYDEAYAGAANSDDGHGKIYTWNINMTLNN